MSYAGGELATQGFCYGKNTYIHISCLGYSTLKKEEKFRARELILDVAHRSVCLFDYILLGPINTGLFGV